MNYKLIYDQLILKAKSRSNLIGYSEIHHIIPKSLGGLNSKSNLVQFTAREHFIAHILLAKIHGGNQWYAAKRMMSINKNQNSRYINSRMFEIIKKEWAEINKGKTHSSFGKPLSEEHRKKVSNALKGSKHPMFGKKHSEETRRKISEGNKGKPISDDYRAKMSELMKGSNNPMFGVESPMKGKTMDKPTRLKISEAMSGSKNHMFGKSKELSPNFGVKRSEETKAKLRAVWILRKQRSAP